MDVIDYFKRFNRKERFFLVGSALGNAGFCLSADFRALIGAALDLEIPADAFVAMDYHLDWVYASLVLARSGGDRGPYENPDRLIRAQQEDMDLLVAFHEHDVCRVVLLEAKAATGWGNKQFQSKAVRLKEIFGEAGDSWAGVTPYFLIASPRRPQLLQTGNCPSWMLRGGEIPWMELRLGLDPIKVTRCDTDGRASVLGQYWTVVDA
jgi:hypothetical protein